MSGRAGLGIVYRCISTHLCRKAGFYCKVARTGAVTLIQRFGGALNLNVHFHMMFLYEVYADQPDGSLRFRWVKEPSRAELARLSHTLAERIAMASPGLLVTSDILDCAHYLQGHSFANK